MSHLGLGDAIDLEQKFERFCNYLGFQSKIRDKFGSGFLIIAMKSIKSCLDCIDKPIYIQRDRIYNMIKKD